MKNDFSTPQMDSLVLLEIDVLLLSTPTLGLLGVFDCKMIRAAIWTSCSAPRPISLPSNAPRESMASAGRFTSAK